MEVIQKLRQQLKRRDELIMNTSYLLVLLCAVLICGLLYYKRKLGATKAKKKWVLAEDILTKIATAERVSKLFAFKELNVPTNNFSLRSKMKGYVYHGMLGVKVVAIKRMKNDVWKEVRILNKINYFNLIRIYGLCKDDVYSSLVYEYMEKGYLRDWIHCKSCPLVESWFQIALDIANGLHCLHNFTEPAYEHKDIKSSNVLLNADLQAKIANFGLARSAERMADAPPSSNFVDTRGYMAPEYLESEVSTTKIDVYAFGVVILEFLTGKNVIVLSEGKELLI